VDCDDDRKFDIVARAVEHFSSRYETLNIDGVRISFEDGWGLIRASNTQPVLVMRFEAGSEEGLQSYRGEVEEWLASEM
jgi:phosphomannomutase/phosphoglucomutase